MSKRIRQPKPAKLQVGWREWLALPDLGIDLIKCKVDSGARSSALDATFVEPFRRGTESYVRFGVCPVQFQDEPRLICEAPTLGQRQVTDSGGRRDLRYVIRTHIVLGTARFPIELTLAARKTMRFRMLLGRSAIRGSYLLDPGRSFLAGKPKPPQ